MLGLCGVLVSCGETTPLIPAPVLVIHADDEVGTGSFNLAAVRECRTVVYDQMSHAVHVYEGGARQFSFGRGGGGPGEIGQIKALGIAPDLSIAAIDWRRRRLLWWEADGSLRQDRPLEHGPYHHAFVGVIAPQTDGSYLDFPLSGSTFGFALTPADTDTLPLIYDIGLTGETRRVWGRLDAPPQAAAPLLRGLLQIGDMEATAESIYVFRAVRPRVEVFALAQPGRVPARSVRLPVWVEHPAPKETLGQLTEHNTVVGGSVELNEEAGGPFARDAAGRFYVIMLGDKPTPATRQPGEGWWPHEQLWVFDADGQRIGAWRLEQRGTRLLRIARNGSLVTLARPSGREDDDWAILVYPALLPGSGSGPPCAWQQ